MDDGLRRNSTSARTGSRVRTPRGGLDLPGRPHAVPDPRPDPDHVERQQLQRAQRGDNGAFAELIRQHDPMLRMVVARLVSPEETDELLISTYVKAYRALPRYAAEQPPRLWLCQLTLASCLDYLRRHHHRIRLRRRGPVASVAPPPPPTVPPPPVDNGRAPSPESGIRIIDEEPDVDESDDVDKTADVETTTDGDQTVDDESRDASATATAQHQRVEASDESSETPDDHGDNDDQSDAATNETDVVDQQLNDDDVRGLLAARALQSLLVEDRVAVVLVDGAGFTPNDTAAVVEVSPATLRTRLGRGRAQLRKQLSSPREQALLPAAARRDGQDLAQWLDRLPVPDHDEEFWQLLGEELLSASDHPAVRGPDPGHAGRLPVWLGPMGRVPGPSTTGTDPGADDRNVRGLALRARQVGGGRSTISLGRWLAGAAVIVLVLAVLGAGFLLAGRASRKDASLGLTSAKVIGKVDAALAADQSIAGTVTVDSNGRPITAGAYQFVHGADGSYRIASSSPSWNEAYNASDGHFSVSGSPANAGPLSQEAANLAPGPPDPTAVSLAALGDPLVSVIRLFDVGQHQTLTNLGNNGLPQYVLDADLPPVGSNSYAAIAGVPGAGAFTSSAGADHIRILIDESLQLPIDVQLTRQQNPVIHMRFTDVSIGGTPTPGTFDMATGGSVTDYGFQTIQLGQAPTAVGYQPLTPSYLPGGFVQTAVTARAVPPFGAPSTAGGRNPPDVGVLVMTYRNGTDEITVTTRRYTSQPGKAWQDPFVATGTAADHPASITAGHFLDAPANSGDQPLPHVWGHDRQYVFTVAGDAPTTELIRVASSLH